MTNFSDANLALFTDVARTGNVAFGGTAFSPRAFTGTIDYVLSGPPDPCASITTITCGASITASVYRSRCLESGSCGFSTPGQEKYTVILLQFRVLMLCRLLLQVVGLEIITTNWLRVVQCHRLDLHRRRQCSRNKQFWAIDGGGDILYTF